MFSDFFYVLRKQGVNVSMGEWLTLMQALSSDLAHSSLIGFYRLGRAVVVKSEADYDKYDAAFLECFKTSERNWEIPPEILDWLKTEGESADFPAQGEEPNRDDAMAALEERMTKQDRKHSGGHHWIGVEGTSPFGNSGYGMGGIRLDGETRLQSAFDVAGERRYRDFREDQALDIRTFQVALRSLRRLSSVNEGGKTELDLDASIHDTASAGGSLRLVFKRPRKNRVKLLLLIDSGGSMDPYVGLCTTLFQAASKSDHWGELRVYYFHNCVRERLYTTPRILSADSIPTDWFVRNLNDDYLLLIVGDALMSMGELTGGPSPTGIETLCRLKCRFPRMAWLTPQRTKPQTFNRWGESYYRIAEEASMFPLTVEGLNQAVKHLMKAR